EDYARWRLELEARLLEDVAAEEPAATRRPGPRAALAVGVALPLVALIVYLVAGNPGALAPHPALPDAAQIEAMLTRLAAKLEENPGDVEGWKLLGRSYTVLGRYPQAVAAYAKAAERAPRDAQLLADFGAAPAKAAKAHPGVRGTVRLAPALRKQVKADDIVFVFARAAEGPAMPLAVLRARAADLPLQFALNDSMAMAQGMTVSAH